MDLDAPLLSTRRFSTEPPTSSSSSSSSAPFTPTSNSSTRRSSLPFYKPELKSGPVRNPGVVPFVWEQKPGQPKPGTGTSSPSRPPVAAPRPPPAKLGSSVRTRKPVTEFASSGKEPIDPSIEEFSTTKNEKSLKEELEEMKKDEKFDQHSVPEIVQATSNNRANKDESTQNETFKQKLTEAKQKQGNQTQTQQEKQTEGSPEAKSESESEEDNFSDALDTLSRTESFVMNCSVSGLSELPKTNNHSPGGSDPEAHKFMMDRFLPAAQAVATGSPQYTFRKVPVPAKEPSRPFLIGTGTSPDQRRVPLPLPYQHQPKYEDDEEEQEEEESEEEGSEEDLEASRRFQAKGCGFFPSFCVKSSLLLMNPVPGLKHTGKSVRTKGGAVKRNGSPLIRSSINGGPGLKDSDEAFETYLHSWEPVYKHKQDQTNSNNNDNQNKKNERKKKNSDTSLLTYWSDSQNTRDGSSPLLHSAGSNGDDPISKSSPFHHSNGEDPISRNGSSLLDPDRFLDAQDSDPKEEEAQKIQIGSNMSGFEERESVVESGFQERESVVMSGSQERGSGVKPGFEERESGVKSGFQERGSGVKSGFEERESVVKSGFEERESVVMSGFQERESVVKSGFEERVSVVKWGFEERERVGKKVESRVSLPLPVPKSPSESWLSRTLPSVGAKKQPVPSFLGMQSKKQGEERWRA
ncbi:hypothetical protein LUZ60_000739 [Juncus effusus]|nr:hypothetical protein LUZ60_000739 [Juncus effusus]